MKVKVKKIKENAQMPTRESMAAAGFDLKACFDEEELVIMPMERKLISTGLAIELPNENYAAFVFARSGLALKEGLAMANGVGVIDSDYRGELCVPAINLSKKEIKIKNGERVAQLVIMPIMLAEFEEKKVLSKSERSLGGFGSTGKS